LIPSHTHVNPPAPGLFGKHTAPFGAHAFPLHDAAIFEAASSAAILAARVVKSLHLWRFKTPIRALKK